MTFTIVYSIKHLRKNDTNSTDSSGVGEEKGENISQFTLQDTIITNTKNTERHCKKTKLQINTPCEQRNKILTQNLEFSIYNY